jgi:hypothetical protein
MLRVRRFTFLYFATTSWSLGAVVVPLLFVHMTETSGWMSGHSGAYIVFLIFLVPWGLAKGIAIMVVCQFFGGTASSVAINIVGRTISDIMKGPGQRSLTKSLLGTSSVIGIAPGLFWGELSQPTCLFAGSTGSSSYPLAPFSPYSGFSETISDIILAREAQKWRGKHHNEEPRYAESEIDQLSLATRLKISFQRPVKMLLTEWVVFSQTL